MLANTQPETPLAPHTTVYGPNTTPGTLQRTGRAYNHRRHNRHQHQLRPPREGPLKHPVHHAHCTTEATRQPPQPAEAACPQPPPRSCTCLHAARPDHAALQKAHSTGQIEQFTRIRKLGIAETRIGWRARWDPLHGNPKMARMDRPRAPTNLI